MAAWAALAAWVACADGLGRVSVYGLDESDPWWLWGPWGKATDGAGGGRACRLLSRDRLGLPPADPRDPEDDLGLRPRPTAPPRWAMLLLLCIWSDRVLYSQLYLL